MATILLESLLASTAASSAACQPRHNGFTSHCNSPHIQPYRHLWPTHSRTPHASSPPLSSIHDITLHTATAAHTATTGTTITAGVPTSTATTTPHSRPSHSTTIDLQAQPIQDSWNPTDHHWDSNTLHGHQLYRTIQPTQWSRKAGVAGLPTFDIFPWQLAYHGTSEFTARTLSNGKYTGFIATRSIAESVFVTHLLQELREKRLDLDGIAETLHTKQGTDIPSKTTQARAFHAPLIKLLNPTTPNSLPGTSGGHRSTRPQEHHRRADQPPLSTGRPLTRTHPTTTKTPSPFRCPATSTPNIAGRYPRYTHGYPTLGHHLRPYRPGSRQ